MARRRRRRLKFVQARLERLSGNQCVARVHLEEAPCGSYVGSAVVGGGPDEDGLLATARATAAALMQAVGMDHSLQVHGVKLFEAFGQSAVLVQIGAKLRARAQALIGFCVAGTDPARAAALAVLNATNRALDIG